MTTQNALINMLKQQLRTGDVLNTHIIELYKKIPRHEFVPQEYTDFAYSDMQIPLPHGQRMMPPLEEGLILQNLHLTGEETVLEVGTGSGFFTALLSQLCKKVISVEYFEDLTERAAKRLKQHQCDNVELITGDACRGWLELAPYDTVIFTGAIESITKTQRLQVLPGGQLFAIVGKAPIMQGQLHRLDHQERWSEHLIFETELPALIDQSKIKEFIF